MGDTNTHTCKTRGQLLRRGFPPSDLAPGTCWQGKCKLLDRDGLVLVVAAQQLRWAAASQPFLWRLRAAAGCPHRRMRLDSGHVAQAQCRDVHAQISVDP